MMKNVGMKFWVLALVVSLMPLVGCKKTEAAAPGATTMTTANVSGTGPVATVNGKDVSRSDFDKQMERTRDRFKRAGRDVAAPLEARLKENLVRKMVEEELIAQKAKSEGVALSADELDAKVNEHKGRFGSDTAFKGFLERTNQSEADVRDDLEQNLLRDKLFAKMMMGQEVKEEDAQKYYDENKDKYKQKEQIKASHILFKVDAATTPADKKKREMEAKKALAEAKRGGADFAAIAKKYSEGPTKDNGGDLGMFSRGRMVKPFEDAAFAAKAGDVIGPVETQFGYHVIKVFDKTPEQQRPFADVKESIMTSLTARQKSKATRELLDKLKADAKITVLEPGVSLDPSKGAALDVSGGLAPVPLGGPGGPGGVGGPMTKGAAAGPLMPMAGTKTAPAAPAPTP
jgi:peptidyl-prolyl cis-trans isomerase C